RVHFERFAVNPGFGGRSSDGILDQTDRYAGFLVEILTEIIRYPRKFGCRLGRTRLPLCLKKRQPIGFVELIFGPFFIVGVGHGFHVIQPDVWMMSLCDFLVSIQGLAQAERHIGLARTQVYIPYPYILQDDFLLFPGNMDRVRPPGGIRRKADLPVSMNVWRCLLGISIKYHLYFLIPVGCSKY